MNVLSRIASLSLVLGFSRRGGRERLRTVFLTTVRRPPTPFGKMARQVCLLEMRGIFCGHFLFRLLNFRLNDCCALALFLLLALSPGANAQVRLKSNKPPIILSFRALVSLPQLCTNSILSGFRFSTVHASTYFGPDRTGIPYLNLYCSYECH